MVVQEFVDWPNLHNPQKQIVEAKMKEHHVNILFYLQFKM